MNANPISEQVTVVTGASSGVGRAVARAFGSQGAKVGLIARTQEGLEDCAEEIRRGGGDALMLPLDVSNWDAVHEAARTVVARWGRIDTWVNDAMVGVFSPATEMRPEEYRRVIEVNYLGTVYGTLAALEQMRARDSGTIIQIGSALAYRSIPLQSAYCASKAAIRGFTDSVRVELLHDKSPVKICMLQLPAVNTPQFDVVRSRLPNHPQPVPPIFQPEVIAKAVLYAAVRRPRELWIGGSTIRAIVGQFFARRLADRYLAWTGYRSQQTDQRERPHPDNVDQPLPGDKGAHGDFDSKSFGFSLEFWLRAHAAKLAAIATIGVGIGMAYLQLTKASRLSHR
jgi:NADP-dependent 3-hydroxy acid dehydrogenase YdfG